MVTNRVIGKISQGAQRLLQTLVEIQSIAYGRDESRSPRSVLRFHNLTWLHTFLCWQVIGYETKQMSCRKFYGVYFHKMSAHAAIQHRLVSGKSCHAEEQERIFNAVTNITRATSSNKPGHIIGNVFLRIQAEKEMGAYHSENIVPKQQAHISKLAKSVPSLGNTFSTITSHSSSWQAHLERISDFLVVGKDVWWTSNEEGDVEFFDSILTEVDSRVEGPRLHHFRSSNFKDEEEYLNECWSMCLEKKIPLPLHVLRVKDANKDTFIPIQTHFLRNQEFIDDLSDDVIMTNEASVVVDGESTVDMPEEHGTITVDASDDEQESCENTIHYNLIMPEQEDDLQQSMLNNTSVDTVSTTGLFYIQNHAYNYT